MIADDPKQWGTQSKWVLFNANESVRVKLKPLGLAEYRRQREELNACISASAKPFPTEPTLDEDGYYRTQLWALMRDFGHLMRLGMETPFETEILFDGEQIRQPASENAPRRSPPP